MNFAAYMAYMYLFSKKILNFLSDLSDWESKLFRLKFCYLLDHYTWR